MPTEPTTTEPLRLTVRGIADLYWIVTRRVSHESAPQITSVSATLRDGIFLHCDLSDYPRAHLTAAPGCHVEIAPDGVGVESHAGTEGYTHHSATVDRLRVVWVTRAGAGPILAGGGGK